MLLIKNPTANSMLLIKNLSQFYHIYLKDYSVWLCMISAPALRQANPWWRSVELIDVDEKIKMCEAATISYDPELRHQIEYDFEPDNTVVYTMRGPRQVGKTTMIKLQIRDFLKRDANPWNIFYYSFDLVGAPQDVADIISGYLEMSAAYRSVEERTYMFLDEITSVDDWQKAIKFLIDGAQLKHCTILATGSQAVSILRATERLPGRRGYVADSYDKILKPMSFSAFARVRNSELAEFIKSENIDTGYKKDILADIAAKRIPDVIHRLSVGFVDVLNRCLNEYMLAGGLPKIVNEKIVHNFVADPTYKGYLDSIKADWGLHSADMVRQFGLALATSMGSAVSWSSLLRQTDFGSWSTVQKYVYLLNDASVIHIMHLFDEESKQARFRKEKKIYFTDPFYYNLFNNLYKTKDWFMASEEFLMEEKNAGRIAECVAADHLARLIYDTADSRMMFDRNNHLFYWKDKQEVDFVLYREGQLELPVEIKYRNRISYRELGGLASFLDATGSESGLVLSKDTLEVRRDYAVIPLAVFLALV